MLTQLDLQDNMGNWMVKYFEKKRLGFLHDFNISILFVLVSTEVIIWIESAYKRYCGINFIYGGQCKWIYI